ncbi:MAG: squalene synthase HpnC [Rubrivivax sp.]|jgi:squalene synthase HpnC|nr:squalene synthase HpnC [Rubrivivax sp.]
MGVGHYENFPVASRLSPPALRPAIVAIYRFARTADDLADEGDAAPGARLADLAAYRAELDAALAGGAVDGRWSAIHTPLARSVRAYALPVTLLHDLLDAFEQDVRNPSYPDRTALLDYCRRSANPIGRLLLHLYGIDDAAALRRSDAICSALQLVNFWQDLGRDGPRGRCYVPEADRLAYGVPAADLRHGRDSAAAHALVAALCAWARGLMLEGAALVHRIPGRAGWELRLVVQGGLRVLARIARMDHATLAHRPALGAADLAPILWQALRMRRSGA